MIRPDKIVIDGRDYRWRDIVELRRQQLEAWKAARPEQPALFTIKEDSPPAAERSATGRQSSLRANKAGCSGLAAFHASSCCRRISKMSRQR